MGWAGLVAALLIVWPLTREFLGVAISSRGFSFPRGRLARFPILSIGRQLKIGTAGLAPRRRPTSETLHQKRRSQHPAAVVTDRQGPDPKGTFAPMAQTGDVGRERTGCIGVRNDNQQRFVHSFRDRN